MIRGIAVALVVLAGCSGNPGASSPDMTLARRAATDHAPLWQLSRAGGIGTRVQAAPEVYTVVWPDDPYAQRLEGFVAWMLGSDFWTGALKEYGIGPGKSMGIITLPAATAPAMLTQSDFASLASSLVSNGSVPAPNANTNIVFFVPATTVVTAGTDRSCVPGGLGGFHDVTRNDLVYSVVLECFDTDRTGSIFDQATRAASHEIAEAASDPLPGLGFSGDEADTEIGDLCNFSQFLSYDSTGDATHPPARYWVQRFYSFAAAKQGNVDPCLPVPWQRPFFGITTNPPSVAINRPKQTPSDDYHETTLLEPFAYGDVGTMHWSVISSTIDVEPAGGTVQAGDTIRLDITVPANADPNGYEIDLQVESQRGGSNTWPFFVDVN